MEYYPFPALLRSADNTVQEYGKATIAQFENALDFTGDFVPLLPLGTDAVIEWILGEKVIASFQGNVYLASKGLLRLVNVDAALLEYQKNKLAVNVEIAAQFFITEKKKVTKAVPYTADILFLSNDKITIRTSAYTCAGQTLLVSAEVDFLTLHNMPVVVEERVLLRKDEALLLCSIQPSNHENFISLTAYAAKLAEIERKANL